MIASGKLENRSTAKDLDSFFILKTTDTVGNVNDYHGEISDNTFSSELVHETPRLFFVDDIAELKRNTDNVMVGEIEFLMGSWHQKIRL